MTLKRFPAAVWVSNLLWKKFHSIEAHHPGFLPPLPGKSAPRYGWHIKWGWQECLVMGWDHSVLLLEQFAWYLGTNPVSVCSGSLTASPKGACSWWLTLLSEPSDKQAVHSLVIVGWKHAGFYSKWNRLFPASTFSLNDVFPAWTGTQCLYVLIVYVAAQRIVRFMSYVCSILLISCQPSGRARASRGCWCWKMQQLILLMDISEVHFRCLGNCSENQDFSIQIEL